MSSSLCPISSVFYWGLRGWYSLQWQLVFLLGKGTRIFPGRVRNVLVVPISPGWLLFLGYCVLRRIIPHWGMMHLYVVYISCRSYSILLLFGTLVIETHCSPLYTGKSPWFLLGATFFPPILRNEFTISSFTSIFTSACRDGIPFKIRAPPLLRVPITEQVGRFLRMLWLRMSLVDRETSAHI